MKAFKGFHAVFYIDISQGNIDGCAWFDEKIYYEFSPI